MAINTPFFHANNSLYPQIEIRLDQMNGFQALELPAIPGNSATHGILVALNANNSNGSAVYQIIPYATAALRDTDLAALKTAVSTSL